MPPTVEPFRNPSNDQILNAIRKNSTLDYQRRIPAATKANVQDTIHNLLNYRPAMNEFINSLVNRIGLEIVIGQLWSNPLAKFKRGMLEFGDTIEEIIVGLLEAKRYNPDRDYLEKDIFGAEIPDVQSSFHKVNRQDFYKLTVNETLLRRAFLTEFGISGFITKLMDAPATSDQWDEFLLTTSLFKEYYDAGGFFNVNIPDLSLPGADANDAKQALRRMRELSDTLPFISTRYNASGMPVAAQPDELELFITPEANSAIDVEALAGAFNIDKAQFSSRTTVIPKEYFGIDSAQAFISTKDFFVIADTRLETLQAINPAGLLTNFFFHHHEVVSASRFVPAVMFSTEPSTPIVITETPVTSVAAIVVKDEDNATVTSVERGNFYSVSGDAVTTPAEGPNDAVRYVLSGALSPRTKLTQSGILIVAIDEDSTSLVITEYAVDNNAFIATATLPVVGDKAILWPNPEVQPDADNDGLFETTPLDPIFTVGNGNVIIPTVEGVQYKKAGVNVADGSTQNVPAASTVVFTAVAKAGFEITPGATVSWSFVRP